MKVEQWYSRQRVLRNKAQNKPVCRRSGCRETNRKREADRGGWLCCEDRLRDGRAEKDEPLRGVKRKREWTDEETETMRRRLSRL